MVKILSFLVMLLVSAIPVYHFCKDFHFFIPLFLSFLSLSSPSSLPFWGNSKFYIFELPQF